MIKVDSRIDNGVMMCSITTGGMGREIIQELGHITAHILLNMCKGETKDITVPMQLMMEVTQIATEEIIEQW